MKTRILHLCLFILSLTMGNVASASMTDPDHIEMAVLEHTMFELAPKVFGELESGNLLTREMCKNFDQLPLEGVGRRGVELAVLCQAIYHNPDAKPIKLTNRGNRKRLINEVAQARFDVLGGTIFIEGQRNVIGPYRPHISNTVIKAGSITKHVCSTDDREDVLSIKNIEDLKKLSGVTVETWQVDLKTLQSLGLKEVVKTDSINNIFQLIYGRRADFTLASEYQLATVWKGQFECAPNLAIGLDSDRVFLVAPDRADLLKTINRYLDYMNTENPDVIPAAFKRGGVN